MPSTSDQARLLPGRKVLITGGLGFIGSAFTRRLVSNGLEVTVVDAGTYAAEPRRLSVLGDQTPKIHMTDVLDPVLPGLLRQEMPDVIVHFAADTHVTRSEMNSDRFFRNNVEGTRALLEATGNCRPQVILHISTDEVYGSCGGKPFREDEKVTGEGLATSAYARSKALADDLARSWADRAPVVIARPTNCIGPWQHPEKAVPRWISRAMHGEPIPVWGRGHQIRDWMFVDDLCDALQTLLERGAIGEVYNIGPEGEQRTNLEVAKLIARTAGAPEASVYLTTYDRPGHDERYAVDTSKLRDLGWRPATELEASIRATVEWFKSNPSWWQPLLATAESLYEDSDERTLPAS